ncbi:hypothetical protein SISSUDRAFT_713522 [Sistotremastrum suecicum HHB10207 ss-3]|uniref:Uncharacterized protein n=1 Tax=Sistotremastrum suecicum HHB10207 ss-3 TaxID=1314776 RepID=A0A165WV29_9AGAM|nr:hypothetical protein SISSUDRAFT_713522 [Sistotremastrum suecicum HHB10207 ss-3]
MLPETAQTETLFTIVDHLIRSLLRTRHQGLSTPLIRAILKIVLHLGSIFQFEAAETSLNHVLTKCQDSEKESRNRLGAAILREAALLIEEKHDQGHLYAFALYFRLLSSIPKTNTAGQVWDFAGHDSAHAWSTALKCGTRILIESFPKPPQRLSAVVTAQSVLAGGNCKLCAEAWLERAKRSHRTTS